MNTDPIFTISGVERATDHYQRIGFEIAHHDETDAFAKRGDGLTIHLAPSKDNEQGPGAIYLHCEDADEIADAWRKPALEVAGPEDYDYGKREGSHTDPDGNLVRFGSPLRSRSA